MPKLLETFNDQTYRGAPPGLSERRRTQIVRYPAGGVPSRGSPSNLVSGRFRPIYRRSLLKGLCELPNQTVEKSGRPPVPS